MSDEEAESTPPEEEGEGSTPKDDDDDDKSVTMSLNEFRAHRLDAWDMAYARLKGPAKDWGQYVVDAADVMILARFIEGIESEGA